MSPFTVNDWSCVKVWLKGEGAPIINQANILIEEKDGGYKRMIFTKTWN